MAAAGRQVPGRGLKESGGGMTHEGRRYPPPRDPDGGRLLSRPPRCLLTEPAGEDSPAQPHQSHRRSHRQAVHADPGHRHRRAAMAQGQGPHPSMIFLIAAAATAAMDAEGGARKFSGTGGT